jgi:hypothetical protein
MKCDGSLDAMIKKPEYFGEPPWSGAMKGEGC